MSEISEGGATPKYYIDGQEMLGYEAADNQLWHFANHIGLTILADLYGNNNLADSISRRLGALQEIAEAHWDFRKGAERQTVDWNEELIDQKGSAEWEAIFRAGWALGLVSDTKPENKTPNSLVVLGGANRAPLDRLRYGLESVDDFGQVVYLGSTRPTSDIEREKAADYAPNAQTEFELGCGALETRLGATVLDDISIERDGDTWGMRLYEFPWESDSGSYKTGFALSTPQYIGEHRANTYDNYRFFADRAELADDPEHSIVAVTTGFYTAGQHFPGVQELVLPYGVELETIGHSAEYSGVDRKASQLLMETKAAVDAAVRLNNLLETVTTIPPQ